MCNLFVDHLSHLLYFQAVIREVFIVVHSWAIQLTKVNQMLSFHFVVGYAKSVEQFMVDTLLGGPPLLRVEGEHVLDQFAYIWIYVFE